MIFKQFTTYLPVLPCKQRLLLHPKVHDFQAIHNRAAYRWQTGRVVTTSKGTWFSSNSQRVVAPVKLITVVTTSKGTWFSSNSQPADYQRIQRQVVTTSKGTWFSSNSQHCCISSLHSCGCYYIQRYMIFKQFTTLSRRRYFPASCYYIQRYMIFKQFTTSKWQGR